MPSDKQTITFTKVGNLPKKRGKRICGKLKQKDNKNYQNDEETYPSEHF